MEATGTLTAGQREKGQKRLRIFMMLNAIPVACLMENVIILYALRNGLSDPLVAVLASFIHLTMPFMILGKQLVARLGLAKTWGTCWGMRYLSISIIIFAPFFHDTNTTWMVALLLLAGYFGLTFFRSLGLIASTPLAGEITTQKDRGNFISGNFLRLNVIYLACMVLIIWLLQRWDMLVTYQAIIAAGCLVGLIGAYVLTTVPETERPRIAARQPIRESLGRIFRETAYRNLLVAWCAGFAGFALIVPFAIMAIKNGYGLSDSTALSYSVMILVGSIGGALVNSIVADHVGPRPLLVLYMAGFFLVCVFWALAPAALIPVLVGASFLVAGCCKMGLLLGLGHYFLSLVSEDDRIGIGLFVRVFSGAAAGLAGTVLGAGLLKGLAGLTASSMAMYRWYFRIMLLVLIPLLAVIWKLPRLEEWKIRDILGLFLAPRDLRAMVTLNKFRDSSNSFDDMVHVRKLADIASTLSEDTLLGYLNSAHLSIRTRALRALGRQDHLSKRARDALREQLTQGEYTTAWVAAEIIGEKGVEEAVPELRQALDSRDVFLESKAMRALVQLADRASFERIVARFEETDNPRLLIGSAHALGLMGDTANIPVLLGKATGPGIPPPVCDELLCAVAGLVGHGEEMYKLLKEWQSAPAHIEYVIIETLPAVRTIKGWRAVFEADNGEARIRTFAELCAGEQHGRTLLAKGVCRNLAEQALQSGVLEKFFMCSCILNLAEPTSPSADAFLQSM